jgi:hypothetical protein
VNAFYAVTAYIIGLISGMLIMLSFAVYYGGKIAKRKRSIVDRFSKELNNSINKMAGNSSSKTNKSVSERLEKVRKITNNQLDMQSQVERPQKNALDGKYKNNMNKEVKRLEEEKKDILMSILKDGFDPMISVMMEDGVESMPLSDFMVVLGFSPPKETTPPNKVSRFSIIPGGKVDAPSTPIKD